MTAIARTGGPPPASNPTTARTTPDLEAKMRTCRAQLADWVACPSAKTPEGKAKIEQVSAKLDSIKEQIKKSAVPSPSASTARADTAGTSAPRASAPVDPVDAASRLGGHVDTYA